MTEIATQKTFSFEPASPEARLVSGAVKKDLR